MSTETTQPLPPDSLDDQLDSLLRLSASEAPAGTTGVNRDAGTDAVAAVTSIEDQLSNLMAGELAHIAGSGAAAPQDSGVTPTPQAETAAERIPVPVISPPPPVSRSSAVAAAVPSSVEDLDAQLANLTESLLAETSAAEAEEAAKRAAAEALTAEQAAKSQLLATGGALGGPREQAQASHSTRNALHDTPASLVAPQAAPAHHSAVGGGPTGHGLHADIDRSDTAAAKPGATTPTPTHAKSVETTKLKTALQTASGLSQKATPLGMRVLTLINKPLQGQSSTVRDSLGWLALGTVFNAVCVWVFVGFLQKPPEFAVPHDAPHIKTDEPETKGQERAAGREHGTSGGKDADEPGPTAAAGHDDSNDGKSVHDGH